MPLALLEKTDLRGAIHPFRYNFDGIFRASFAIDASSAHAETSVAQNGLFEVDFVSLEKGRILKGKMLKINLE